MSAGGEQAGEKTHAPTEKRRRDAATKGNVLRSKELSTAGVILMGAAWLAFAGPWVMGEMAQVMRERFIFDHAEINDFAPAQAMTDALLMILPPLATIAAPVILITLLTQLGLSNDGRWVNANLNFKGSRINPLSGLKRMFGPNGLIEMGKGILKVLLLGVIAWFWARNWLETIAALGRGDIAHQLSAGWSALTSLLFALAAGLVVIALVDVPIVWIRRLNKLKMTHQEMRDENKQTEGSPEMRAARRQRQREIATGGVAHAMREAQFVITNPSHFAIAMIYDPERANAPLVLAKGRGDKAQAMKELAREYGVPLLEFPQLARSVYFTTRENQMIREELYSAIASVLAFVMSLKRGEAPQMPLIDVPVELRFDADGRIAPLNGPVTEPF